MIKEQDIDDLRAHYEGVVFLLQTDEGQKAIRIRGFESASRFGSIIVDYTDNYANGGQERLSTFIPKLRSPTPVLGCVQHGLVAYYATMNPFRQWKKSVYGRNLHYQLVNSPVVDEVEEVLLSEGMPEFPRLNQPIAVVDAAVRTVYKCIQDAAKLIDEGHVSVVMSKDYVLSHLPTAEGHAVFYKDKAVGMWDGTTIRLHAAAECLIDDLRDTLGVPAELINKEKVDEAA